MTINYCKICNSKFNRKSWNQIYCTNCNNLGRNFRQKCIVCNKRIRTKAKRCREHWLDWMREEKKKSIKSELRNCFICGKKTMKWPSQLLSNQKFFCSKNHYILYEHEESKKWKNEKEHLRHRARKELEIKNIKNTNCIICGLPIDKLSESISRDHIVPLKYKLDNSKNLAFSHHRCNTIKGAKTNLKIVGYIYST